MGKENVENDQYYTKENIAQMCIDSLPFHLDWFDYIIEPSAGRGDFYRLLPTANLVGIDIDPKISSIIKSDFFDLDFKTKGSVLTIGNPPFGKNASLAYTFFQHAAQYSDCIAFILPRTFRKPSMINRLDRRFHLVYDELLPLNSFYIDVGNGKEDYSVPCVFQVWLKKTKQIHPSCDWARSTVLRDLIKEFSIHEDFDFVNIDKEADAGAKQKQRENSDFCVRRVGASAGKVYDCLGEVYRDFKSHYYIKQKIEGVKNIMTTIQWNDPESPKFDVSGNPSISKHELIKFYINRKGE